jgi:vacuolar-type H+-ATPase subunit H
MTTATQTATPNALAAVRQAEDQIVRKIDAAAHGAAADIRRATGQARERIEAASREAAAFVAGVLAACLEELEGLAAAVALDTNTVEHVPALPAPRQEEQAAEGPAALSMPAAAQTTAGADAAPAAADDDEQLLAWVHGQRQAEATWSAITEAVRATGRDVTEGQLKARYYRFRDAHGLTV